MTRTQNIFLIGPMGSGKTTIGRILADMLSLEFYDMDKVLEDRTGVPIAWIFDYEGEAGFRERETELLKELSLQQGIVLATGGGVVLNPDNRAVLAARGHVIYLMVSLDEQLQRTSKNSNRPLLETDDKAGKLIKLAKERTPLYEEIADYSIRTDDKAINQITKILIEHIKQDL